jgi:hypothetical protein
MRGGSSSKVYTTSKRGTASCSPPAAQLSDSSHAGCAPQLHAGGLAPPLLLHTSALNTTQEAEWRARVRRLAPSVAGYVQQYTAAEPVQGVLPEVQCCGLMQ